MEENPRYVGIDVSKAQVDVAVRPTGQRWAASYNETGVGELVSQMVDIGPAMVLLEATGGLELPLVAALAAAALPVVVVNPRQVRDFARATGTLAKTDALDAAVLAHFADAVRPSVRPLRDAETRVLSSLAARRHQVLTMLVSADRGFYTHAMVAVCRELAVRCSITVRQHARLRNIIEAIPEKDWMPIPYWMDGAADVAETSYTPFQSEPDAAPVRLIVRRVKPTPNSQLALLIDYSYHGFITDRDGDTLELEADHRRHAEIENAIRDLKYGVGLNHLPSGRFAANAAWLAVQVMAHNLARWAARIGLGEQLVTTKTLRRRFFSIAGRLTRTARRLTLHLPQRWPRETQFSRALARLRAIPLPA